MSLIPDLVEDLLPNGSFDDQTVFSKTSSIGPVAWQRQLQTLRDARIQEHIHSRKKEYFRQIVANTGSERSLARRDLYFLTDKDIRQIKTDELHRYEHQLRQLIFSEKTTVKQLLESDANRQLTNNKGRLCNIGSPLFRRKLATMRFRLKMERQNRRKEALRVKEMEKEKNEEETKATNLFKAVVDIEKKLAEYKIKTSVLESDLQTATNNFKKVQLDMKKLKTETLRNKSKLESSQQQLITLAADNKNLESEASEFKRDLDLANQLLGQRDARIKSLAASCQEADTMKRKLERELGRLLKETAGADFQALSVHQLALLRKTTPNSRIDIEDAYDPILDSRQHVVTLGSGTFGTVYAFKQKGRRCRGRKNVAVKVLNDDPDGGFDFDAKKQEAILEARLLKLFRGSGCFPNVLGTGTLPVERHAIVMEFLGDDTTYQVTTLKSWTSPEVAHQIRKHHAKTVLHDILTGLKALHSMDVLHNDIKSDNVIVKKTDHDTYNAYLIDLGNASTTYLSSRYNFDQMDKDIYNNEPLAMHYAPELIFENACTTTATDLYQIGRLIYLMGEDLDKNSLRDIGKKCLSRDPHERLPLDSVIKLVAQL